MCCPEWPEWLWNATPRPGPSCKRKGAPSPWPAPATPTGGDCPTTCPSAASARAAPLALDMESATIAANGFRFRVPYGVLLCVSDKPLHGEIKLPRHGQPFLPRARRSAPAHWHARHRHPARRRHAPAAQPQIAEFCGGGVSVRSVLLDRLRWVVEAEDRGSTRTLLHAVGDSLKNWAKSASKAYAANAGSY